MLITSPETVFTNKQSLDRLNRKFGLTLSSDAVFRKVMYLVPVQVSGIFHEVRNRIQYKAYPSTRKVRTIDR